jgi:hypothetical protein
VLAAIRNACVYLVEWSRLPVKPPSPDALPRTRRRPFLFLFV